MRLKQREEKKALDESAVRRREELRGELLGNNRKEKELALKNAQSRLKKLEDKGFWGRLWNWKTMRALRDKIPELKDELREITRAEDEQTGLLERDIRRKTQELERRQSLERAALEKEYVRPANDNSLKKYFERADHQHESHGQDTGRTRTMTPPGYGLRR